MRCAALTNATAAAISVAFHVWDAEAVSKVEVPPAAALVLFNSAQSVCKQEKSGADVADSA